jgi:hypothetical protein
LDCSLDWLITGVPENTHNYTLEPEEITLVEQFRELDSYGRELTLAVVEMECARAERQADDEAVKLHDLARRSARRGAPRLRRLEDGEAVAVAAAAVAAEAFPVPPAALTSADLIRGGKETEEPVAAAEATPVPKSLLPHSANLPAGLRRRSVGLYDMPVSAGVGEFLADATRVEDIVIPDDPRTAEADYALRINGDSMEPKYHSGDILLIQSTDTVEEGELGIFILDGAGYFKKYGGDHLISLNSKYPPIRLRDFEDVSCCGRVVGKLKKR